MIPFNLICKATMLWKSWIWTFWPIRVKQWEGGLRAKYQLPCCCICDSIYFYMQHDLVLKKLNFELLTAHTVSGRVGVLVGSEGKIFATMLLHMWFHLIWYVRRQRSEKVEFWHFDTPRVRQGEGVCGQNMYYHIAAFVIPFFMICNITMFWKSWILTF